MYARIKQLKLVWKKSEFFSWFIEHFRSKFRRLEAKKCKYTFFKTLKNKITSLDADEVLDFETLYLFMDTSLVHNSLFIHYFCLVFVS